MNTRKVLIAIVAASTVVLFGVLILARRKPATIAVAAETVPSRNPTVPAPAVTLPAVTLPAVDAQPTPAPTVVPPEAPRTRSRRTTKEATQSPEFLRARAEEERRRAEIQYSDLFRKLNLPPDKLERFKTLLAELRMVRWDIANARNAMPDQAAMLTPAEGIQLHLDALKPVYEDIRQLLGDTDYAAFDAYWRSLTERQELAKLTRPLQASNMPLTEAQFDTLALTLAQLTAQVRAANGGIVPLDEPIERLKERYDQTLAAVKSSTSPAQYAELQRLFDQAYSARRANPW